MEAGPHWPLYLVVIVSTVAALAGVDFGYDSPSPIKGICVIALFIAFLIWAWPLGVLVLACLVGTILMRLFKKE